MTTVRPLDWHADWGPSSRARTVKGWFAYPHTRGWNYEIKIGKTFRLFLSGTEISRHPDLESAKAAAQADYDMRIRAALIDPQPAEAGRVPYMGQIMAECDCPTPGICEPAGHCAALTPAPEPVAWVWLAADGRVRSASNAAPDAQHLAHAAADGDGIIPVYAAPPAVPPVEAGRVMNDADINAITLNSLGKWPSFEAQSWACKVAHQVLAALTPTPAAQEPHPDDLAVDRFAAAMKMKMAKGRAKGRARWDDKTACSDESLAAMLIGHIPKGNAGNFEDIANLAMMLHQRGADPAVLATPPAAQETTEAGAEPRVWRVVGAISQSKTQIGYRMLRVEASTDDEAIGYAMQRFMEQEPDNTISQPSVLQIPATPPAAPTDTALVEALTRCLRIFEHHGLGGGLSDDIRQTLAALASRAAPPDAPVKGAVTVEDCISAVEALTHLDAELREHGYDETGTMRKLVAVALHSLAGGRDDG